MTAAPRAALATLVSALERHLEAAASKRGDDDPAVIAAYQDVTEAFEAYDDALLEAYDEMTPLDVYSGDEDEYDDSDDEDDDDLDDEESDEDDSDDDEDDESDDDESDDSNDDEDEDDSDEDDDSDDDDEDDPAPGRGGRSRTYGGLADEDIDFES